MFYTTGLALILIVIGLVFYIKTKKELAPTNATAMPPFCVLEIRVPKITSDDIATGPLAAEHMFASLHGLLKENPSLQEHISFELFANGVGGIVFYCTVPLTIKEFIQSQIYAQYPSCQIIEVPDYFEKAVKNDKGVAVDMSLANPQYFPIKTFRDFEVDPLSAITSVLTQVSASDTLMLQLLIKPNPDVWQSEGHAFVKAKVEGKETVNYDFRSLLRNLILEILDILSNIPRYILTPPSQVNPAVRDKGYEVKASNQITAGEELQMKAIEFKLSKIGFLVTIRLLSFSDTIEKADMNMRSLIASFKQFSIANLNGFVSRQLPSYQEGSELYRIREFKANAAYVLTTDELASIFHLPSGSVETPSINWVMSKKAEPPANLPIADCNFIGETLFRNQKVKFGLRNTDDRLRHMYLIGKTGTGKSTLFKTLIAQDIANGHGVGVLDPHGELIEQVLEFVPDHRIKDVVIVDPSDADFPVGINLLEYDNPIHKNLMASALVAAIKTHFDYSWGPRLEYLLNYAVLTLLDVPGTSLLGITRLLSDVNYQKYILHKVKDPVVKDFWDKEFKEMKANPKLITEAIAPIQNKINRFLSSTTIRNILGQKTSSIDIWDIMNSKKILLMNLSKGKIGTDNANLLGALLVSRIQFMALRRAELEPAKRNPFYLYVDEFQNFVGGDFESILSESRKYGVGLHLTHQYTSQLPEALQNAVFGNVGTIASFSLGAQDARLLETEFEPYFTHQDLISLERFQIYIKLMIDGMTSQPFSARILLPWKGEIPA
ncbi:MAG: hypothetical protein RLY61_644, partial [Candidatus Parcubacteria bacterium]